MFCTANPKRQTDLASREDINRVKERVHSINAFAELIETNSADKCPLDRILGLHSFSIERVSVFVCLLAVEMIRLSGSCGMD